MEYSVQYRNRLRQTRHLLSVARIQTTIRWWMSLTAPPPLQVRSHTCWFQCCVFARQCYWRRFSSYYNWNEIVWSVRSIEGEYLYSELLWGVFTWHSLKFLRYLPWTFFGYLFYLCFQWVLACYLSFRRIFWVHQPLYCIYSFQFMNI